MNYLKEDFKRYRSNGKVSWSEPSMWVIVWYRFGRWGMRLNTSVLRKLIRIIHLPVFAILTLLIGVHLPRGAKIGPGFRIYHFGGIILNPSVVIGRNCTLRHGVTIGNRKNDHDVPVIGDNVDIGAGAKVLGAIQIGNNVSIGANAVVLCNVPDDHIAIGVPAKIFPKKHM